METETETPADEPAHDVLAAEAFAMPAGDPALSHGPVDLPEDPTGIEEPHDVLAAEEFALPAGGGAGGGAAQRARTRRRLLLGAVLGGLLALVVRRVFTHS